MRQALVLVVLGTSLLALALPARAGQCSARSGAGTAALVELYTSEGCDSCPPADRWLSSLAARGYGPERLVPIALHVDHWDYLGWKDPYARRPFSLRQRRMAQLARSALVYTPQVLLQGRDFRAWGSPAFDQEVARINARPAGAKIALSLDVRAQGPLEVEATAELAQPSLAADSALYLATYENKLQSQVAAGENRGRRLGHDYVAFEWAGPIAFGPAGRLAERRSLPLLPRGVAGNSGVVALVQHRVTAEVLQALTLPACPG